MTRPASPKHRRRQRKPWPVLAVVLLMIAVGLITVGVRGHQVALAGPVTAQDPAVLAGVPGPPLSALVGPAASPSETLQTAPTLPAGGSTVQTAPTLPAGGSTVQTAPALPAGGSTVQTAPALPAGESTVQTAPALPAGGSTVQTAPTLPAGATTLQTASAPPAGMSPVDRSTPVALRIPAINLAVSLSTLGLNPDRTVQVPTDFQEPGWFDLGPSPGQVGSAVILGHVDSYQGPAVFFRLRALHPGDQVEVSLADGMIAHFMVTTVVMYPKDQFPADQVYASHGGSALQLVTCGGAFDTHTRSYLSNVVAYTTLTSVSTAAR